MVGPLAVFTAKHTAEVCIPRIVRERHMDLDPDFHCLSYGDVGERRRTKTAKLGRDDLFMRLGRTSTIEADLQRAWERGPIVLLQTKVTRDAKKIASLTSRKLSRKSLEARVGFEPRALYKNT